MLLWMLGLKMVRQNGLAGDSVAGIIEVVPELPNQSCFNVNE